MEINSLLFRYKLTAVVRIQNAYINETCMIFDRVSVDFFLYILALALFNIVKPRGFVRAAQFERMLSIFFLVNCLFCRFCSFIRSTIMRPICVLVTIVHWHT